PPLSRDDGGACTPPAAPPDIPPARPRFRWPLVRGWSASLEDEGHLHRHPVLGDLTALDLRLLADDFETGDPANGFRGALHPLVNGIVETLFRGSGDLRDARDGHGKPPWLRACQDTPTGSGLLHVDSAYS